MDLSALMPRLRCPRSGAPLRLDGGRLRPEGQSWTYPVVDGVPVLLWPEALPDQGEAPAATGRYAEAYGDMAHSRAGAAISSQAIEATVRDQGLDRPQEGQHVPEPPARWLAREDGLFDLPAELEAYRQADELGDAGAAILLGNALRSRGEFAQARDAYERAESRGHREAGMSLGNLLTDLSDKTGAKAAYLRSIELGSTMAVLNLGLMLAEDGEADEAAVYLQRAADTGDSGGFWGLGKVREQQGD